MDGTTVKKRRILLVTDAWEPQVNGVVNTLKNLKRHLEEDFGREVAVCHPFLPAARAFKYTPYNDVRLLKNGRELFVNCLRECEPDWIHICTEGPLGIAARRYCARNQIPFTTSFHSRFDIYMWKLYRIPGFATRSFLRWFHRPSERVLVPAESIRAYLVSKRFRNVAVWDRGVDTKLFYRDEERREEKTVIYVARASKEKNVDEFCQLKGYKKIFVGGGPYLDELKAKYAEVEFVGNFPHDRLAEQYNRARVFVFPSWFDTFGIVMLEAMACGLPVAAHPAPGAVDVVRDNITGALEKNLQTAVDRCFANLETLSRNAYEHAQSRSWLSVTERFLHLIES